MALIASLGLLALAVLPLPASAWNISGHMLSGIIAYQVISQENPQTIDKVKAVLEKHPWYANQWQGRLQDVPATDRDLVLFMQAARWADDVRSDKLLLGSAVREKGKRKRLKEVLPTLPFVRRSKFANLNVPGETTRGLAINQHHKCNNTGDDGKD